MSDDANDPGPIQSIITPVRLEYQYTPGQAAQRALRGIAAGRLVGLRCPSCKKVYFPARGACARCGVALDEEVELSEKGTVVIFCVVRVPSTNIDVELPYVAAHVVLDGADIAFQGLIQGCKFDEVRMGMRVEAVWAPKEEMGLTFENLRYFQPIDEPDVPYEQFKEHA